MKSILVHMAYDDDRERRLATAVALAKRHGAHLVGLFTKSPYVTPPAIVGRSASAAFLRELEVALREQEQDVRAEFDRAIAEAGVGAEWLHHHGDVTAALAFHSHVSDLLVVSRTPPETVEDVVSGNRPDHVMMTSGCGTLIVPEGRSHAETGTRVLIAWTRTREAARAVHDALPILRRASSVTILTCRSSRERPGEVIRAYLLRHGVMAEVRADFGDNDEPGEVILDHAQDRSADLVVMGAYGHSRLRELVLGGTTAYVLSRTTIPVLMSH